MEKFLRTCFDLDLLLTTSSVVGYSGLVCVVFSRMFLIMGLSIKDRGRPLLAVGFHEVVQPSLPCYRAQCKDD